MRSATMQDWAVELQRFFTSEAFHLPALVRAANARHDPEIRSYLQALPPRDDQYLELGLRLVRRLEGQGFSSEATILELVTYLPTIAMAVDPRRLPIEHRSQFSGFLKGLTDGCRNHPETVPSLAMMCVLSGRYHSDTRDFAAARGAFEEAVKLAESELIVAGTSLHLSKGCASASYRFLLSEARDNSARAFALLAAQRDGQA